MDLLGHVNNVRYLDYLDEGLHGWLGRHDLAADAVRVRAHRLGFDAPMVFGRADAEVRTDLVTVDDGTVRVAQTLRSRGHHGDEEPTSHLRAESTLEVSDPAALRALEQWADPAAAHEWREVTTRELPHRHADPVTVRTRDLGPHGVARPDAVVEWFQESRVRYFMDLHTPGEEWGHIVVARTDVELPGDVRRGDHLEARTWVAHLGTSSFSLRSDLVGADDAVLASATVVAVCFDADTQRPAPMTPAHRAALERELAGA